VSAEPCEELVERERLREVVVCAGIEARHAVTDGVSGGQHQHRRPDLLPSELAARLEAVDPGQHDVEHDRVVLRGERHPECVLAAVRDVGRMPFLA
jgi:hypothetical protein